MKLENLVQFPEFLNGLSDHSETASSQGMKVSEFKKLFESFQKKEILLERYKKPIQKYLGLDENIDSNYFSVYISIKYSSLSEKQLKEFCRNNNRNYAFVDRFQQWAVRYHQKKVAELIIQTFKGKAKATDKENRIKVHKSMSERLLIEFKDVISWENLSSEKNFYWTKRTLELGENLFSWWYLQKNDGITWDFELIEMYKDRLNWEYVSNYVCLDWTAERIEQFRDYVVFGALNGSDKSLYKKVYKPPHERNWYLANHDPEWYFSYYHIERKAGNLSGNSHQGWTESLIQRYEDLWDWGCLSQNSAIRWNNRMIEKYARQINFEALSRNLSVDWNEELISKYEQLWDWDELMKNYGVNWTVSLISKFSYRIDFTILARYAKIDKEAISFYSDKWDMEFKIRHSARRNSDGTHLYYTHHTLWEVLSGNRHLIWEDYLINKYLEKIVLKNICGRNVQISVETLNKFWEYERKEMEDYRENYDGVSSSKYINCKFRYIMREATIVDLTLEKFLENEVKWWGVLNSYDFLHRDISKFLVEGDA